MIICQLQQNESEYNPKILLDIQQWKMFLDTTCAVFVMYCIMNVIQ